MTTQTDDKIEALTCHRCGYDLRAHPADGVCPECEASVAESQRLAAIPRRPAWRDSDPRWRRRILAGVWVLVFVPVLDALKWFNWIAAIPVPQVVDFYGSVRVLDDTLLSWPGVYQPLAFCIGVVLLFSTERRRRRCRLDWTRRWGVIGSYLVLFLSAIEVFAIGALVLVGITSLFLYMPLQYQPRVTDLFLTTSTAYLWYGPDPSTVSQVVLVAFSSITILLACIPLFDALRSTGGKRLAAAILAPLALFSAMHLGQVVQYYFGYSSVTFAERYGTYFRPELFLRPLVGLWYGQSISGSELAVFLMEASKWCVVLVIAIWLSIAQFAASRRQGKTNAT